MNYLFQSDDMLFGARQGWGDIVNVVKSIRLHKEHFSSLLFTTLEENDS